MKKRIVFIDTHIPSPDRDAGSKSTFLYVRLFLDMGYSILFAADKVQSGDESYIRDLSLLNIGVVHGCGGDKWKDELSAFADGETFFFINRIANLRKFGPFIREKIGGRILFYGHDLLSMRKLRQSVCELSLKNLLEYVKWRIIERRYHPLADAVYYPSSVERDILVRRLKNRTVRRINLFYPETPVPSISAEEFAQRSGLVFVGGFRHRPNLDGIMWFLESVLPLIKSGITIHIVGSSIPEKLRNTQNPRAIIHGFLSAGELEKLYGSCRMAVIPLRYGAGVKGKFIEAMFHGLPVISTSIGAEGIENIETVIPVCDSPADFAAAIDRLYNDCGRLAGISETLFSYINDRFSKEASLNIIRPDLV